MMMKVITKRKKMFNDRLVIGTRVQVNRLGVFFGKYGNARGYTTIGRVEYVKVKMDSNDMLVFKRVHLFIVKGDE